MRQSLEPIEVFDWYDGIVVGLVRLPWKDGTFLASLLSWSQEDRLRALGLIPVNDAQIDSIREVAQGEWGQLVAYLRDLCRNVAGGAMVVLIDERQDEVVAEAGVQPAEIQGDMIADVEQALDPSRRRWLSVPSG